MLTGTYEAVTDKTVPRNLYVRSIPIIFIFSLIISGLFAFDPQGQWYRFGIRTGSRELITGLSFIMAGPWLVMMMWNRGAGVKLVAGSFVGYGVTHLYYFTVVMINVMGGTRPMPVFFGLIELVMIAIIGFGLVIWQLEEERERLQKTNHELDSFIYSASHDLRAPIASILGLSNLARMELEDPKALEFIGLIETRVKKLDAVITDILQLSKATKAESRFEVIDFNKLLEEIVSDVSLVKGAKVISLHYADDPANHFWGDYKQTKVVLGNLLSNAVKYHNIQKTDPYISILFEKTPKRVFFEVTDNGEGIAEEHQGRVFEMFYRASHNSDGTGLGLYIVKEALTRINGKIFLKSQAGVGTSFRVSLEQPF
jgi:signal transduction histidine kinase